MSRFLVITLLVTLFASAMTVMASAGAGTTKRVLVLYSLDKDHPAHSVTEQGIREIFRNNGTFDVQLFQEYLDLGRFPTPEHAGDLAEFLRHKYSDHPPDAIITVYPSAADLLRNNPDSLFPHVPVIAAEISRSYASDLDRSPARRRITGTIHGDNFSGILEAALRMKPGTKRVALVTGTSPLDAYGEQIFRNGLKPYAGRLEVIDIKGLPMAEILTRLGSLPPDTIVLYHGLVRDGAGRSFIPREALEMMARASNAPIFGVYDAFLGFGIVGGRLVSFDLQGKAAAGLVLRVLAGETPGTIPFDGDHAYVDRYDWRELKKWQIPESAVPPGATVDFRRPTVWEEHRGEIVWLLSVIVSESALIAGLLINRRSRRRAEQSLERGAGELKQLTGRLITAQEEERSRIARELHDDITQRLAVLAIEAGTLEQQSDPEGALRGKLSAMTGRLARLSEDIHALSRQLHPSILDDMGLVRALEAERVRFARNEGISVRFNHENLPVTIPRDIALALYRVTHECLRNIARHAGTATAHVDLSGQADAIHLTVADTGCGFDARAPRVHPGIGLASMKERVELINGTFAIDATPGEGTIVTVVVPLGGEPA